MDARARVAFVREWWGGLACVMLAYAVITGVRSLRDLYAAELLAEALGVPIAPPWVFYVADLPGAVLSAGALVLLGWIQDSRIAMLAMLSTMLCAVGLALVSTALFQLGWIGGLVWQLSLGTGLFITYSVLGGVLSGPPLSLL